MYVAAVIGDLERSKDISERRDFQKRFRIIVSKKMRRISRTYAPYTISAGDEVQAAYIRPRKILLDLWRLMAWLAPQRLRFSIGLGRVTTGMTRSPLFMDGPAFHLARDGLVELKERRGLLAIRAERGIDVGHADQEVQLLAYLVEAWKPTRWRIVDLLLDGYPPSSIAQRLDLSSAAVYKNIREGAINLVLDVSERIGMDLEKAITARRRSK